VNDPPSASLEKTTIRRCANRPSDSGPWSGALDSNKRRTYSASIVIKEAKMHPVAVYALRDIVEIAALGMFLIMIALAARAFGG
jgi:hypothetical protein